MTAFHFFILVVCPGIFCVIVHWLAFAVRKQTQHFNYALVRIGAGFVELVAWSLTVILFIWYELIILSSILAVSRTS
jgi:type III secretory pathway component EscU